MRFWKGKAVWILVGVLLVAAIAMAVDAVSRSEIARLKAKVEAREWLTADDISLAERINATTGSHIDVNDALARAKARAAGVEESRGGSRNPFDDYSWAPTTYNWVDISGTGVPSGITADDGVGGPFNIGFSFPFYSSNFTQVTVCSNGFLEFGGTATTYSNVCIPNTAIPNNAIYPFWDDLNVSSGGSIMYLSDPANNRFIVAWLGVPPFSGTGTLTAEAILYANGNIVFQYQHVLDVVNSCTVGIENAAGTSAVQVACNGTGTIPSNNWAVLFNQPSGTPQVPTSFHAQLSGSNVVLTWVDPTTDTQGNPLTPDSLQLWRGLAGSGTRLARVNPGVQTYTDVSPAQGVNTYSVRAFKTGTPGAAATTSIFIGTTYQTDFEANDGGWISSGGWEWGAPTYASGPTAHSGTKVWGTVLAGTYDVDACYSLTLDLGLAVTSAQAAIDFWGWYQIELNYDGCNFQVSTDQGATWTIVPPQGDYPGTTNTAQTCMPSTPAWMNSTVVPWTHYTIPLGQFIGQVPKFRFLFGSDPSLNYAGYYFDDMQLTGLGQAQQANISGTVTLSGGSGVVTNATVSVDGPNPPTTHPAANGTYSLQNCLVGQRNMTVTLAGYDTVRATVNLPVGGLTNQNFTIRRSPPPAPTGLVGSVNSSTGRDSLSWVVSPDLLVDGYKLYRKVSTDTGWTYRRTVYGRTTHNWCLDTLTSGIWDLAVTAIDTGVIGGASTPVESPRSAQLEQLYGELPPVLLTANGNFDNKIHLAWLAPGTPPVVEASYDDGTNEVGGIGFNGLPAYGWLLSHFTTVSGPATVTRYKFFFTTQAVAGDAYLAGCFADSATLPGRPSYTERGVVNANHAAPFNAFREFDPADQTFPTGSFYVGVRQLAANNISVGGDQTTTFRNNTFFYRGAATGGWLTFESASLLAIPMFRCFVIGSFGNEVELAPTPNAPGPLAERIIPSPETSGWISGNMPRQTLSDKKVAGDAPLADSAIPHSQQSNVARAVSGPVMPNFTSTGRNLGRNPLDDVVRYIIYRDGTRRDSVLGTVLAYDDTPLPENQTHQYYVTAKYDNGNQSGPSNTVTAACNMAPSAPTNVAAAKVGTTQARISWSPPTTNSDGTPCVDLAGFRIYRDGTQIGTVPVGTNQYTDTPPSTSTFYGFSVKAYDEVPNIGPAGSAVFAVDVGGSVPFGWVDISANGTSTAAGDDQIDGPFDLGFSFSYYGGNYTQVKICSNGFITFNPSETITSLTETPIPSAAVPNCALYPFWDDLNPVDATNPGAIKYHADAANHRFIIAWIGVVKYATADPQTFEAIIGQDGSVTFNYQTIGVNTSCVAGVENCDGTQAYQLCYDGTGAFLPTTGTSVKFWGGPSSGIQGIVRAQSPSIPIEGVKAYIVGRTDTAVTDPGGSYSLGVEPGTYTVCFRHTQYCDTCYAGVVVVEGTQTTRNATMRQAVATFSVTSINRSYYVNTPVRTDSFTIQNTGGPCALNFTITDSATWVSESPVTGSIPAGGTTTIHFTYGTGITQPGFYQSSIMVYFNSTGSPRRIPFDLTALTAGEPNTGLPTEFALHQNYPNPFNASTSIRFDVPRDSRVDIVIYNMMGQEVAHPVSSLYTTGSHQVIFDATNLPSGAYVIKMTAGNFSQLGKMMLLK